MPICSYLVIPREGDVDRVHGRLADLPACEVVRAENRDLLILVTDTEGLEEEEDLRSSVEAMDGIQALLLTFGEIDPDTPLADPITVGRHRRAADQHGSSGEQGARLSRTDGRATGQRAGFGTEGRP
jgi:nitrate reductase NapAB chaperone NapD